MRAKEIEPRDGISLLNFKNVLHKQRGINFALKMEKDRVFLLQQEKKLRSQALTEKDNQIHEQALELQKTQQKLSETETRLSKEKSLTNDLLNIPIEHHELREIELIKAKQKIIKFERIKKILKEFLPLLKLFCPSLTSICN